MIKKTLLACFSLVLSFMFAGAAFADIMGPTQPASGPGGSNYAYGSVMQETRGILAGKYIIYEPSPKASEPLPVLCFLHGWLANVDPALYEEFVNHLVKKGHIVIWPYYQTLLTPGEQFDVNAAEAIKNALNHIAANPGHHAQPKYDGGGQMYFGILGHSAGATTTANLAAMWEARGIPKPKAIMCMEAGQGPKKGIPFRDFSNIPSDIYMLIVVGTEDVEASDEGKAIWNGSPQIPGANKDWILVNSDYHGSPDGNDLKGDHYFPFSGANDVFPMGKIDALDWYGVWKWSTALFNYAFFGTDGEYCLGNTASQRYLGHWSDGQAVVEPEIYDYPVWP